MALFMCVCTYSIKMYSSHCEREILKTIYFLSSDLFCRPAGYIDEGCVTYGRLTYKQYGE